MLQVIFLALVFLGVVLLMVAASSLLWPDRTRQRLQQFGLAQQDQDAPADDVSSPAETDRRWWSLLATWTSPLARLLASEEPRPAGGTDARLRFLHAGIRDHDAADTFMGIKVVLTLLLPALMFLVLLLIDQAGEPTGIVLMACAAALGWVVPDAMLRSRIQRRQQEMVDHFPELLDLVIVCVEAGLGTEAAMMRVTDEMRSRSSVLSEEMRLMNLELNAGVSRLDAFRNLAMRTGVEDINGFVTVLNQSERFGTSIVSALRTQSDLLRTRRRQQIEEDAGKMPVKLILPMAFFILPSLLLVILGPAMVQMFRQLSGVMGGL